MRKCALSSPFLLVDGIMCSTKLLGQRVLPSIWLSSCGWSIEGDTVVHTVCTGLFPSGWISPLSLGLLVAELIVLLLPVG